MASRTEDIVQQLLDSIDTDGGPERVLDKHRKSKGPLYTGLGKATSILKERLDRQRTDLQQAQSECLKLESKSRDLSAQVGDLNKEKEQLSQNLAELGQQVGESQGVLDQVHQLKATGFGEHELARLGELLGQIAASQGAPPEDGVKQFFETVERYEKVVSLDLEATRAEARVGKAKAEVGQ